MISTIKSGGKNRRCWQKSAVWAWAKHEEILLFIFTLRSTLFDGPIWEGKLNVH